MYIYIWIYIYIYICTFDVEEYSALLQRLFSGFSEVCVNFEVFRKLKMKSLSPILSELSHAFVF